MQKYVQEIEDTICQCGARLIFLPPDGPELNSIKVCFGQLKRWIQKHANLDFPLYPELGLDVATPACTQETEHKDTVALCQLYGHFGYHSGQFRHNFFESLKNNRSNYV